MINANKDRLASFFSSDTKYVVPFYQRSYVWKLENWEILWENLYKVFSDYKNKIDSEHFIGTLITKQIPAETMGENKNELIDGQQRLTTVALLLKAIKDTASGDLPKLKENIDRLLIFEDSHGNKHIKIIHCKNDQKYFNAIIGDDNIANLPNSDHGIIEAYSYFKQQLVNFNDTDRDALRSIILEKTTVVSMLLSASDDEQVIFDTINSLGVKLTTAELLKNYIFKEDGLKDLYESHWFDIFESDEETIEFWNKDKTSGRTIRTNVEVLLYCYLIIATQCEVRLERLFKEYKDWLSNKNTEEKKIFLNRIKQYAELYSSFPGGEEINEIAFKEQEKRFFHIIENLEITTAYPLILFIYNDVPDYNERVLLLELLESYLVRRNICGLTTKNYNNIFIQLIKTLKERTGEGEGIKAATLKAILAGYTEDTNRFPDDEELRKAFYVEHVSNKNAKEILYCISLYQASSELNDVVRISSLNFSVEHMMPVKWETNWLTESMTEDQKKERSSKLKTLGNLTLVKKRLNSKMQNASWSDKKAHLKVYATLGITKNYLTKERWDESEINARAGDLFKSAVEMWLNIKDQSKNQIVYPISQTFPQTHTAEPQADTAYAESKYIMRVVPCNKSMELNKQFCLYFQPSGRKYRPHSFVGLYSGKRVSAILEIDSVFDVTYDGAILQKTLIQGRETMDYDAKIVAIINAAKSQCGYEIDTGHRFFCAKEILQTDYIKQSVGGIMGARIINLKNVIGEFSDPRDVARRLNAKSWN